MYPESDLLPISALQHWLFCPRQCGLIHLEQVWEENVFTAQGRGMHERVHEADNENRPGIRIVRGLRVRSHRLGLIGQADVVEFHAAEAGVPLDRAEGLWRPYPIEYKRGKPKLDACDEVQLCAQVLCLEEMLGTTIFAGAFFYGRPRRRKDVEITDALRRQTEEAAAELHALIDGGQTPAARYSKKCSSCSLYNRCLPKTTGPRKKIDLYLQKTYEPPTKETGP